MKTTGIFNENEIIENILENGFTSGEANYFEVYLLAKQLFWFYGFSEKKVKENLPKLCQERDRNFNIVKNRKLLCDAIKHAQEKNIRSTDNVIITEKELLEIERLKNFKYQKLAFCMLVWCKSRFKSDSGNYYYFRDYDSVIIKLSNLRISKKDFVLFHKELLDNGLIEIYKPGLKKNNFDKILFAFDNDKDAIIIDNFSENKIVEKYLEYYGGECIYCENCGNLALKTSNRQKYCLSCYSEKKRESQRKSMKKQRKLQNVIH